MLTVITSPAAPQQFTYKAQAPSGGSIQLTDNGGAVVLNQAGMPTATIAQPWAVDASGQQVTTYYATDGSSLTQVVEHGQDTDYPVVADPTISYQRWDLTLWFSQAEVRNISDSPLKALTDGLAAGWACALLKNAAVGLACAGSITLFSWALGRTFDKAAQENKCVWLTFNYFGDLESWGRYSC